MSRWSSATSVASGCCSPARRRFSQCSTMSRYIWHAQLTPPSMKPKFRRGCRRTTPPRKTPRAKAWFASAKCPGAWDVAFPARSMVKTGSALSNTWSGLPRRPSVATGGCSTISSVSSPSPRCRRSRSSCWSFRHSPYSMHPRSRTCTSGQGLLPSKLCTRRHRRPSTDFADCTDGQPPRSVQSVDWEVGGSVPFAGAVPVALVARLLVGDREDFEQADLLLLLGGGAQLGDDAELGHHPVLVELGALGDLQGDGLVVHGDLVAAGLEQVAQHRLDLGLVVGDDLADGVLVGQRLAGEVVVEVDADAAARDAGDDAGLALHVELHADLGLALLVPELGHRDVADLVGAALAVGVGGGQLDADGLAGLAVAAHVRLQAGDDLVVAQRDGEGRSAAALAEDALLAGHGFLGGLDGLAVHPERVVELDDVAVVEGHAGATEDSYIGGSVVAAYILPISLRMPTTTRTTPMTVVSAPTR